MSPFVNKELSAIQDKLLSHPIYSSIKTLEDVKVFMQYHVFAVWDFMSLLKALQINLTNTQVPWYPQGDPAVRKMINEIVLGEESDEVVGGLSHFEWYLLAMKECGANTNDIDIFLSQVATQQDFKPFLASMPAPIKGFVETTLDIALNGETHQIAAAFTIGRENLIPSMFIEFVKHIGESHPEETKSLVHYFERHIEVDGDDHGPLALQMLTRLCDNSQRKVEQCLEVSKQVLNSRIALWDGAYAEIMANEENNSVVTAIAS